MKKQKITQNDYIKAHRKASREEEIQNHTHPINYGRVQQSKKVYNRKKDKADDKGLPLLFPPMK
ncbi:MAG: hypothetical protein KA789_00415 [Parabacteroides sp.]|jgi:hypothetical protein|nr:hypothetical protein [Parabacteroides sp.]MBP8758490.1 hypothetical protein [Parabacteroides sp.]MBP9479880.1 hypothetical protein [Parabacteroides sp.]MBP9578293.1 hypothetical protein [Parabacteroides sp.]MDD2415403.1 hypothetical protein [Parabacteroides sp.]